MLDGVNSRHYTRDMTRDRPIMHSQQHLAFVVRQQIHRARTNFS